MKKILFLSIALLISTGAHAHGDGEHTHEPAAQQDHSHTLSDRPKAAGQSAAFELVAQLEADELSILIDRFDTGEPVLGAAVEVEYAGLKAPATFHADHGDYAVTDAKLLEALAKPGSHTLRYTVRQGEQTDTLEATLQVSEAEAHAEGNTASWWWIVPVALVLGGAALALLRQRARRKGEAR